jgi:hypothetical protein
MVDHPQTGVTGQDLQLTAVAALPELQIATTRATGASAASSSTTNRATGASPATTCAPIACRRLAATNCAPGAISSSSATSSGGSRRWGC